MLAVGARLAPDDRAGLRRDHLAVQIDMLAVALHLQLLEIGRETRRDCVEYGITPRRLRAEEVVVPDRQQAQQQRQVLLRRRGAEMLVHGVEAGEQCRGSPSGPIAIMVDRPMAESIE